MFFADATFELIYSVLRSCEIRMSIILILKQDVVRTWTEMWPRTPWAVITQLTGTELLRISTTFSSFKETTGGTSETITFVRWELKELKKENKDYLSVHTEQNRFKTKRAKISHLQRPKPGEWSRITWTSGLASPAVGWMHLCTFCGCRSVIMKLGQKNEDCSWHSASRVGSVIQRKEDKSTRRSDF